MKNPAAARELGISMVYQHFSLFDTLTVAENVWLGLDKRLSLLEVTRSIAAKAAEYGLDIDPTRPVHTLSVGQMQRVEIIRALLTDPKLQAIGRQIRLFNWAQLLIATAGFLFLTLLAVSLGCHRPDWISWMPSRRR